MSEGYTIGGDASIKIEEDIRCFQTFTPTYTHTIAYLDLDCSLCAFYRRPTILITTTDEEGKPTDYIVTTGRTSWLAKYPTDELVRVRFNLDWATVHEGVLYAIVIYFPRPGTGQYIWWQYDTAGATYDGGMRGESMDRGETWTLFPDSDFMFFEFGKEPAPLPSPDPPVGNFSILDLQQEVTATGIKITVTTNVPCHLYCYWTATEPEKHLIPILTRGIELHTQLKMCFVNWHENEQEEAGDTLFHTFTKEPWAHCETRWLTFRAKVMENWVKSVGPIFKKHRVAPEEPTEICFDAAKETGYLAKYGANWDTAWSAEEGLPFASQMSYELMARRPGVRQYTINRGILRFDTSPIPDDKEIVGATLKIAFLRNVYSTDVSEACFVPAVGCGDEMNVADYGALRLNTDWICDSIEVPTLLINTYYEMELYQAQLGIINKEGQTRIGLRGIRDIDNLAPFRGVQLWVTWYGESPPAPYEYRAILCVRFR